MFLFISGALIAAGCVIFWVLTARRRLLTLGSMLLFLTLTVHERLQLGNLFGAGMPAAQGGLSIVDLLWLGYAIIFAMVAALNRPRWKQGLKMPGFAWLMAPYIWLSVLLPVFGGLAMWWSTSDGLSYISTGIRQLQWMSFGLFAYYWVQRYGILASVRWVYATLTAAVGVHATYAAMQWLVIEGVLPEALLIFDHLYENNPWFKMSPRPSGLALEPTALGVIGAIGAGMALVRFQTYGWRIRTQDGLLAVCSVVALVLSSDRLLLIGAAAGILGVWWFPQRRFVYGVRQLALPVGGGLVFWLGAILMPKYHLERIAILFTPAVLSIPNVTERLERWAYLLSEIRPAYPLGTGIQPTYVTGIPADNYYLTVFIQGGLLYLLAYLIFLLALVAFSTTQRFSIFPLNRALSSSMLYFTIVIGMTSLGTAPMFDVSLVIILWILVGINLHLSRNYGIE